MSKKTFQPNKRREKKKHGFMSRMQTKAGRNVLSARKNKGRQKISK